jgi:hypothetical protein
MPSVMIETCCCTTHIPKSNMALFLVVPSITILLADVHVPTALKYAETPAPVFCRTTCQ